MDIGLPNKLSFHRHDTGIEIVRKWFGTKVLLMTAFAVFWDGFLLHCYSSWDMSIGSFHTLFPLLHVGAGIGLTYSVIAGWLNRTYIRVDHSKLSIRHRPVPWLGNRTIETSNVRQIYCKEVLSRNQRSTTTTYSVHVITGDGHNITLLKGLENSEQAIYIEQHIEKYLRIRDTGVKGEWRTSEPESRDRFS